MTFRGTGVQGYAKGKALVAAPGSPELADLPEGGVILVVEDLSLEDSAAIDFSKVAGIVAERGDASSSVCGISTFITSSPYIVLKSSRMEIIPIPSSK